MRIRRIAFYGSKGVGTTTVVGNVAAALAEAGQQVIVVGCDGEVNSTAPLHPRQIVSPLFPGGDSGEGSYVVRGFQGIRSLELGQFPRTTEELTIAIHRLRSFLEREEGDFILYDITGDLQPYFLHLACDDLFDELLVITSAQVSSLRKSNQILSLQALGGFPQSLRLLGLVGNFLSTTWVAGVVDDFARKTALPVIASFPRSLVVSRCEFFGETLIDAAPLAHHTYLYRKLARILLSGLSSRDPIPLSEEDFEDWSRDWGDRLYEFGEGLVDLGSGI